MKFDVLIVGGGFYGCSLALDFARKRKKVCLLERENYLLSRASYNNQARVHGGYHYPRSFLTGARSRENFERFTSTYAEAIESNFSKIYAIAKSSKVTSNQFVKYCDAIKAPLQRAPSKIHSLFNSNNIEDVFLVEEFAFNAVKLAELLNRQMHEEGVEVRFGTEALNITKSKFGLEVSTNNWGEVSTDELYICTYSQLNEILDNSKLPSIPLRHELTEMPLVVPPPHLHKLGITIMDGPFWSMMPFPATSYMTFSHVRYTPHYQWADEEGRTKVDRKQLIKRSSFEVMKRDAARFLPDMQEIQYRDSLWEVKTILPRSDHNDSRPILFKKNYIFEGLNLILGGKIDNAFDIISSIEQEATP